MDKTNNASVSKLPNNFFSVALVNEYFFTIVKNNEEIKCD